MNDPEPTALRLGCDVVARLGTPTQEAEARANLAFVLEIHRQTEQWFAERAWLAERQRQEAA